VSARYLYWIVVDSIVLFVARTKGELAFEANEAMGIGIIWLLCLAIFIGVNMVVQRCHNLTGESVKLKPVIS